MDPTSSIDVVVCTYTDERWSNLTQALESVERQTLTPGKVVLVVDRNPELVERARRAFRGLEVVASENGGGLSAARNTGLARCTAEVVAFLDDDAVADPRWVERLAREYVDARALGVGGKIKPSWAAARPRWFPEEFAWVVGCTYRGMPETKGSIRNLIGANMSVRRDVLEALGGFTHRFRRIHDDTEMCIRALASFPGRSWVYAPKALVRHTVPASRARWRYFVARCYEEGRSKAVMTRLTGTGIGLRSERGYVLRALPVGMARGLVDVLRGDPSGAMRSAAILIGVAVTAMGYLRGLVNLGQVMTDLLPAQFTEDLANADAQWGKTEALPAESGEIAVAQPDAQLGVDDLLERKDREPARRGDPEPTGELLDPTAPVDGVGIGDGRAAVIDAAALLLVVAAVVAVLVNLRGARAPTVIAAATFVPGWALLGRRATSDLLTNLALAVAFSFALVIAGSLALGWTGWWHPGALGVALASGAAGVLVVRLGRRLVQLRAHHPGIRRGVLAGRPSLARTGVLLAPLAGAMALWRVSLSQIHLAAVGRGGLAPAFPAAWYAALAIIVAGGAYACFGRRTSGWVMAAYIAGAVVVLYTTLPALTGIPDGVWVYKHIGVTRFIGAHGGPSPSVDIYNEFPGLFTAAAALASLMHANVLNWAVWGEPFFGAVEALMVAAVAFSVTSNRRASGFSALLFTVGDWVSQTYFAPQPLAFSLSLAVMVVLVRGRPSFELRPRVVRLLERATRRAQMRMRPPLPLGWSRAATFAAVLGLEAVIVASHELTPFMVVLQAGILMVLGVVRAWWLLVAMSVLALAYIAPYAASIQTHYGALTSPDPFANILAAGSGEAQGWSSPALGEFGTRNMALLGSAVPGTGFLESIAGRVLEDLTILLMLLAAARATWLGRGRRALVLLALAVAPIGILFATSYGGEATERVYLFSSVWRDILIALGILTLPSRRLRWGLGLGIAAVVATLFVATYYAETDLIVLPRGEVTASNYFEAHAPAHSVLMLATPDFPIMLGPRYPLMVGQLQQAPKHKYTKRFWGRELGPRDVRAVITQILDYSRSGFLVFSKTEYLYARLHGLTPPGGLARLERAIASSPHFRLWYRNADARIYRLVARARPGSHGGRRSAPGAHHRTRRQARGSHAS